MKIKPVILLLFGISLLLLQSCASENQQSPEKVVIDYLQAKINRDGETIQKLLCAEMETYLEREMHTFETVSDAELRDTVCSWEDGSDVVRCEGKIVASYGQEQTEFPLGAYRVVEDDGEWKWCGEAP
jgi:hypothetical protein